MLSSVQRINTKDANYAYTQMNPKASPITGRRGTGPVLGPCGAVLTTYALGYYSVA